MNKFNLGTVVTTSMIHNRMESDSKFASSVISCFQRYTRGDWGSLSKSDKAENDKALRDGKRIFASYNIGSDKINIITEWDRSVTTILFSFEY